MLRRGGGERRGGVEGRGGGEEEGRVGGLEGEGGIMMVYFGGIDLDSDSDSLYTKFYNKGSMSKSGKNTNNYRQTTTLTYTN